MEQILIDRITTAISTANYGEVLFYGLLLWQMRGIRNEVKSIGQSLKVGELRFESIENEQSVLRARMIAMENFQRDNFKKQAKEALT